ERSGIPGRGVCRQVLCAHLRQDAQELELRQPVVGGVALLPQLSEEALQPLTGGTDRGRTPGLGPRAHLSRPIWKLDGINNLDADRSDFRSVAGVFPASGECSRVLQQGAMTM